MSEPDEAAVEAVAEVLAQNRNPFPLYPPTVMGLDRDEARLMLATPVVADWRRDAERLRKIRGVVDEASRVAAEHPCAGACIGCGSGPDDACDDGCRCDEGEDCAASKAVDVERRTIRQIAAMLRGDGA